ncbi:MAG: hypothetical protein ACTSRF_08155 [Candidatus Freyarchaeota archaeon]
MAEPNKPPYTGVNTLHWNESNIDNYYEAATQSLLHRLLRHRNRVR